MADKFAQINEFLKLLDHTGALETIPTRPIRILDAGCGSSYLSFAVYHYLNQVRGIPATLTGVDHNRKLIDKSNRLAAELGYQDMHFEAAPLAGYRPADAPDILLALHACDTATDDALALGIRQRAGLIMAVPCCHHHLHAQLGSAEPFGPVLQHGILRKRFADILTDSFRAQLLRLCGYRTDAVEFVSSEHTDRNLLLRAVRRDTAPDTRVLEEYDALAQYWSVTPYLETLLRRDELFPA
jgi:SAM-dependent methyltransferase